MAFGECKFNILLYSIHTHSLSHSRLLFILIHHILIKNRTTLNVFAYQIFLRMNKRFPTKYMLYALFAHIFTMYVQNRKWRIRSNELYISTKLLDLWYATGFFLLFFLLHRTNDQRSNTLYINEKFHANRIQFAYRSIQTYVCSLNSVQCVSAFWQTQQLISVPFLWHNSKWIGFSILDVWEFVWWYKQIIRS